MKKCNYTIVLSHAVKVLGMLICLNLFFSDLSGQTYCFTSPQGYGEGTTGGGSGDIILVNNETELEAALTATGDKIVIVESSFEVKRLSVRVINKTLLGLPGTYLYNYDLTTDGSGILTLKEGSDNIIIRNLIFKGPGAYDCDGRDHITNQATNLWVDHCEFQDGIDGNFDNKGMADDVTVTWCKFTYLKEPIPGGPGGSDDHRFSNLVASDLDDYPADGHYSITWQYCWWAEGVKARMVRARNAELHMVNCYWGTQVEDATAIRIDDGDMKLSLYLERGVFETHSTATNLICTDGNPDVTVVDSDGDGLQDYSNPVSQPSYNYETIATSDVKNAVTSSNGAGATLIVTTDGQISSGGGTNTDPDKLEAEDAALANGVEVENEHSGYSGSGYVNFPLIDGKVTFNNVDGGSGGNVVIKIKYANGATDRTGRLKINGINHYITMASTGSWSNFEPMYYNATLEAGPTNTIIVRADGEDFGNLDYIQVTPTLKSAWVDPSATSEENETLILQTYPNPLTDNATVEFNLGEPSIVNIALYSLSGTITQVLANGQYDAGNHHITFSKGDLKAGIYILKLEASNKAEQIKIIIK